MLTKVKSIAISLPALAVLLVAGTVSAHGINSGSGSSSDDASKVETTSQTTTSTTTANTDDSRDTAEVESHSSMSDDSSMSVSTTSSSTSETSHKGRSSSRAELRTEAETEVKQKVEKKGKATSAEVIAKRCESRKNGLETKYTSLATNSQRYQDKLDDIFAKAQAYKTSSGLAPANYGTLVQVATDAQGVSAASVKTLADLKPAAIDCSAGNVATQVATFKTASVEARDNLKAYKQAVRAVLKALMNAKSDATTKTTTTTGTEAN